MTTPEKNKAPAMTQAAGLNPREIFTAIKLLYIVGHAAAGMLHA